MWAKASSSITCFDLDPDQAWNNEYVVPFIVTSVYDEGETVDKMHIELKVTDIDDLLARNYKAKLERDGKGVFIWMPRVPKSFYVGIGSLYDEGVDSDSHHAAHSIQAIRIADAEAYQKRVIYYKFPPSFTCNNSHFNKGVRNSSDLKMKMLRPVMRALPKALW